MSAVEPVKASAAAAEAARLMTICNACRYCESLCAVFPAMELRRSFTDGDLTYLANLCHGCGACYSDCQFSPPHEFSVNVPQAFAVLRAESYRELARPAVLQPLFAHQAATIAVVAALGAVAIAGAAALSAGPAMLFGSQRGPGAFYRLMPHLAMATLFTVAFVAAVLALYAGLRRFADETGRTSLSGSSWLQALRDVARLRYLDGGGVGCMNDDDRPTDRRRLFHHLTFYGFGLCFASTVVATGYHYLLGREAPYAWYDAPVVLGTLGGLGLLAGTAGLLRAKLARDPALVASDTRRMDLAFIVVLLLTSATGLALLALRDTAAMGVLLSLHLGVVLALFVTMPYGKFVHGLYRFAALLRFASEQRMKETKV